MPGQGQSRISPQARQAKRRLSCLARDFKASPMTYRLGKCYSPPMTLEDIEEAILKLPPEKLAELRRWFAAFETGMAPPKPPEPAAAKLGRIAGRTVAEFRKLSRES